jgi:YjbE family integral membrane protein
MFAGWAPPDVMRWLLTGGGIVLVDLALSGDNALVIGAVASRLPRRQRLAALLWGGFGAIALRIALTAIAARLLLIPLVQSVGAVIIMIITIRLLLPERDDSQRGLGHADRPLQAIVAILAADASMSLDNVLAIGALARGDVTLLAFGLLVSMALLLLASALIARLIERFSWLLDLTAFVLAYVSADLVLQDPIVSGYLDLKGARATAVLVGAVALTILLDVILRVARLRNERRAAERAPVPSGAPGERSRVPSEPRGRGS